MILTFLVQMYCTTVHNSYVQWDTTCPLPGLRFVNETSPIFRGSLDMGEREVVETLLLCLKLLVEAHTLYSDHMAYTCPRTCQDRLKINYDSVLGLSLSGRQLHTRTSLICLQ